MLKNALKVTENLKPIDQVNFGETFTQLCEKIDIPHQCLKNVKINCGNYLLTLSRQLLERLPDNLGAIEKLRYLTPQLTLSKVGRSTFHQLPLDLDPNADRELLEAQWQALGVLPLCEICLHPEEN
ncbi:uncharacterized protein LOC122503212 [Leptopilina heterotoma]|uniref:uncharacterized protein LOC122503212 n=1 Tax=Leptopilina heterotoma TaxID=63436 RepID=UPI001CAA1C60|nr:uncharacterized protein LOC122503212 [Leptopilina heterotoma]